MNDILGSWGAVLFGAGAALGGALLQQFFDLWKQHVGQKHELRRQFFELKLRTVIDLAQSINAVVQLFRAKLAEAEEWARDEESFSLPRLEGQRGVTELYARKLESEFNRYNDAFALLHVVFPSSPLDEGFPNDTAEALKSAWVRHDRARDEMIRRLEEMLPDETLRARRAALNQGKTDPQ